VVVVVWAEIMSSSSCSMRREKEKMQLKNGKRKGEEEVEE
jgi:hypothetical protein